VISLPANYVLLERIELNASAASVVFANIPQSGYTDLKIVVSSRCDTTTTGGSVTFNGTGTGFTGIRLFGSGSSVASGSSTAAVLTNSSGYTASTYSNSEIYIPNYAGSTNKSVSIDGVSENNATEAYAMFNAILWSNTAAITSVTIAPSGGNFVANSTFSLYGLAAVGTTPVIAPKATGGNLIENDGTYWIHTFTSTGTFTPLQGLSCDYLVVAGGGGGGGVYGGGGGGAGGLRSTVTATGGGGSLESALSLTASTNYTVTIGAGGSGSTAGTSKGSNGTNSVFSTITSTAGGGGGSNQSITGANGGSGGGGTAGAGTASGGTGTANQGYAGGTSFTASYYAGAGGGGAGSVGGNGTGHPSDPNGGTPGTAGSGVATSITGSSVTYATGGVGRVWGGAIGTDASANTGNAGSGGGNNQRGGNGGSGVVIIRYLIA
jgi:hypothetical protein